MDKFLNLGKIRGALFSAIIISVYYWLWLPYWHVYYFGFEAEKGLGTKMIFVGLVMTQIVVIQAGDRARLTFMGGILDKTWNNRPCFVPNIFHFTVPMFNFAILWGLAVLQDKTYKRHEEPTVHVDMSDDRMQYRGNVSMSYTQAQVSRLTEIVLKRLFFDWKRVPEEYYVASFGYRVLLIGILIVCWNSSLINASARVKEFTTSVTQALPQPAQQAQATSPAAQPQQQTQPAPQQYYRPPSAVQEGVKEPQKLKAFQFTTNNEIPVVDRNALMQVFSLPYGSILGTDEYRREYFTFGPQPEKVPERSLMSTRPFCGVIPNGGVARVIVSEPPRYMLNTNQSAIISFVSGKPIRALSQYDSNESYWETYVAWDVLKNNWDYYMKTYKIVIDGKEHPEKPVMVIGVIADNHPDHKVGIFCFGR